MDRPDRTPAMLRPGRSRTTLKQRHTWAWLGASIAATWLVLLVVFLAVLEGLLFADCARVSCSTGPDPDLQRFARLTAVALATMLVVPMAVEWAVRLRSDISTSAKMRDESSRRSAVDLADGESASGMVAGREITRRGILDLRFLSFGENVAHAASRLPLRSLAVLILVLDFLGLFALVTFSTRLFEISTLMGYPIILGWLVLTMVIPVLTLQYLVFGSGTVGFSGTRR